jgi:hypothetical protein
MQQVVVAGAQLDAAGSSPAVAGWVAGGADLWLCAAGCLLCLLCSCPVAAVWYLGVAGWYWVAAGGHLGAAGLRPVGLALVPGGVRRPQPWVEAGVV